MKISNLGVPSTPLTSQAADTSAAAGEQVAAGTSSDTSAYTPSPEFVKLVRLANQQPEVRPALVQAALSRLQQGQFHTPAAAEGTATAMLGSAD